MGSPVAGRAVLRSLFRKALDLTPAERVEFLNDPSLSSETREELKALLDADQGAETFLSETVASGEPAAFGTGERFGPFEARELLGRGGMGSVFRAERVDGELTQTVAIKVLERGWLDPRALDRFRQERQILAGLVHPNVARLLDGGTRSDGTAYLVMEFVDGLALDKYCNRLHLEVDDRVRLFLPLCDAVDYAHQKLIVHRDLKPSNVLVTADGQPKLLDFGIAKVLDETSAGATRTLVLTPDFASPEQAQGGEVTTATDVYGLGAVLYFLLTSRAPHSVEGVSAGELQRAICEVAPERPSALNPQLAGDLENILLKALHIDPRRRYGSVRELSEDLDNYLARRPVRATPDGWAYRSQRFVQRHTLASGAALLALLAIAAGAGVSLYEAQRAQERFGQVRTLANQFVFDFEAAIHDTPGTLEARRMVASTARQYLADLSQDSNRDPALRRELAQSYYRLSSIEINAAESTLAIEHVKKSIDILRALKDDCCGTRIQRQRYLSAIGDLIWYQQDARAIKESMATSTEALKSARAWIQQSPNDPMASRALANILSITGNLLPAAGHLRDARALLEEAVRRLTDLQAGNPNDEELAFERATAGQRLARVLGPLGENSLALDRNNQALAILLPLIDRHPDNVRYRMLQASIASSAASFLDHDASKQNEAFAQARQAYDLERANVRQNPGNRRLLDDAAVVTTRYANRISQQQGRGADALPLLREAGAMIDQLVAADPADHRYQSIRCNNRLNVGYTLMNLNRWKDAAPVLDEGERHAEQVMQKWPDDLITANTRIGLLMCQVQTERKLGHLDAARERCRTAFQAAADLTIKNKEAKTPVENMQMLREEARILGVPDITQPH